MKFSEICSFGAIIQAPAKSGLSSQLSSPGTGVAVGTEVLVASGVGAAVPADIEADLSQPWIVAPGHLNLVTVSLALEHFANLNHIFQEAARVLAPAGLFYVGEYHPERQAAGKKPRFDQGRRQQEVEAYHHTFEDYKTAAEKQGLVLVYREDWADEEKPESLPRLITMMFRKP